MTRTSPPKPRSARRAVAAGVVAYCAIQASLHAGIQTGALPVRDPIYFNKLAVLERRPAFWRDARPGDPPRLLALGSSRTQLGFDAKLAAQHWSDAGRPVEAFNFGCSAAGPVTAYLHLRRLFAAGCKPDAVLVEIHPGFASALTPPYEGRWLHPYRLAAGEAEALRALGWDVAEPEQHTWRGPLASSYCYRAALCNAIEPKLLLCPFGLAAGVPSDELGFSAGHRLKPGERRFALRRAYDEYKPVFDDYRAGGPGAAALRATLGLARERGVQAAVVLMPESSEFRSWYGAGAGDVTLLAYGLARDFGVPLVDARTWVADDELVDGHHPTAEGARQFSGRLAADLLAMRWPARPGDAPR